MLGVYAFIYYSIFSIIDGGTKRLASFHIKYNSSNINKQPVKWYLSNQFNISKAFKLFFNLVYVYICYTYFVYMA